MKKFLKIVAAFLLLCIIIGVGLNLYFTDERLKATIMPYVNDAVDRKVEVESMSLTFFSTFPQPGLSITKMRIPGDTASDTLLSLDEMVASVELFSLFGDQINITEVTLRNPRFTYVINSDSTSNIDFLLEEEEPKEAAEEIASDFTVNIPAFRVTGGQFGYRNKISNTRARSNNVDADISLRYADLIESSIDLKMGGLSVSVGETNYITGLPVNLSQKSTINLSKELVTINQGTFSIRGLALNLNGTLADWSNMLTADLAFSSSSDNFGQLLRLVPPSYEQYIEGLESRGSLAIDGSLKGSIGGPELPRFNLSLQVNNGYLKNPDLPQPVEDIQLTAQASNNLLTLEKLSAQAGENKFTVTGRLAQPLEKDGKFSLNMEGSVNLATVNQFYDIGQFDINQMSGQLRVDGKASGNRAQPEKASFSGLAKLDNGSLKYAGVPKPIENISFDVQGNQSAITINSMSLEAARNSFSMQGVINQPLKEEQRSIDLSTDLNFDLGTIKEFYPIDEDTLSMRGNLRANAQLKGQADRIEQAVQKGTIRLTDGFIKHKSMDNPIRDITLQSTLDGPTLSISKAGFQSGNNKLSVSGTVNNYLSDDRRIDLHIAGKADLSQIPDYYDLKPAVTSLSGTADLDLNASGPLANPSALRFDGRFTAREVHMKGEALAQPVRNLEGELKMSPETATLNSLSFQLGSSDITLNGSLNDYMAYLEAEADRKTTPRLTGSFKSNLLNIDELIDWKDTTATEPIPIHLPDLNSSVTADISKIIVTGVPMQNLQAKATTTPDQIKLEQATADLFGGTASGSFKWDIPRPEHTRISFKGSLDNLQAGSFFEEFRVLGEKNKFHKYISGSFSADVDYFSELNVYLEPEIETTTMNGTFGMTKSRLKGHPLQDRLADLLKTKEFRNIALDQWKSTYTLKNSVFTVKNLRLTSGDIGMEMNGTRHLVKGDINYQMKLFLPGRFKSAIASVITKQGAEALSRENGTIMLPLRITGTHENPQVAPDQQVIAPIIKEYLKGKAGSILQKLFEG